MTVGESVFEAGSKLNDDEVLTVTNPVMDVVAEVESVEEPVEESDRV